MSTSKDAQMVMDEYLTSLTPRGRALLISKRARKNHNKSHKDAEPRGEVRKLLFALLGPPLIPRDIGMPPDDLQLETMEEIRELVQYPVKASSEDDGDCLTSGQRGVTPINTLKLKVCPPPRLLHVLIPLRRMDNSPC
eukprot:3561613-Pleurochrysis_carterae.AAC.1